MRISELAEVVTSVLAALGGGGAIVVWLSSWLGKVWAERLMEKEKARYQMDLEDLRAQTTRLLEKERAAYQQGLEDFKAKLNRESDRTGQTLREKLFLYKEAIPPIMEFVTRYQVAPSGMTPTLLREFEQHRLRTSAMLAIFAPVSVLVAHDALIDYVYDCLDGKNTFLFPDFRVLGYKVLSEIRKDVGIVGDELVYLGLR